MTFDRNWIESKVEPLARMLAAEKMLTNESPDVIIAFKGGNGTANMMKIGREAGVPGYEVKE